MAVYQIDPIRDPRWRAFAEVHPRASVFHAPEWLEALQRTYGYEPVALTTAGPGEGLRNGLVFCRVNSWLTGRRTVSVPFSDHCAPLAGSQDELDCLLTALKQDLVASRAKYFELRPPGPPCEGLVQLPKAAGFCLHRLDLRPGPDECFRRFHKDCIQRKIRRAERDGLGYEEGTSELLLDRFYRLVIMTRRRQHVPPQPIAWFRNLVSSMGGKVKLRLASKDGRTVAGILTLRHGRTLVYKYGCSDKRFAPLGGTHLLLWKAIQEAGRDGLVELDMGRSDWDDLGLIAFKDRWGAARSALTYLRYPASAVPQATISWTMKLARQVFARSPDAVLTAAGNRLYKHVG